ncbi:MAG: LytS/YhcK type 5TM receptor domain-containing protein [Lutibacter sp.]
MNESIVIGLLQNSAILLAFSLLYQNIWIRDKDVKSASAKIIAGLIIGGMGIILMFTPWMMVPGISFDMRSVLLAVSGLFLGTIPTIITMLVTGLARFYIGGAGLWMGLAVIILSGTIGLLWRKFRPNWKSNNYRLELLAMGLVVHIIMSACAIFLPADLIFPTLKTIAIPLIFIYSPVTMLLGILMVKQYKNRQNELAQLKLKEYERRFTQILESGNIVSLMLNNDGSINFCNDYLLRITGYEREEVSGKNWFELFIPIDEGNNLKQLFLEGMQIKEFSKNHENKILTKAGKELNILWYNIALKSDRDEVLGTASIGVNITDSKKHEKMLEEKNAEIESQNESLKEINKELQLAKERAEESDRLKTAFLANMSHEIRTPMNSILGFSDLLKESKLTIEKQHQYIDVIENSGKRMLNIINDIITISEIETGIIEINNSEFNINEQIGSIYALFKKEIAQKGIDFSYKNTLADSEAMIKSDGEKIYAVLLNLVKNAIKFTNHGAIEFGYNLKNESEFAELEFFVKDTGAGIRNEQKELIFERFRQGSESLTRNYEGAGLGLPIAKAFVEMLGGKIWVESKEENMHDGKDGSTIFYFTIPYHIKPNSKMDMPHVTSETGKAHQAKNLKILIVEDDVVSESMLEIMIEEYCEAPLVAKNGLEAVQLCKDNPDIDFVLMDIKMPELNGYEATEQIRKFNKDLIIFAQTAFALPGDREKAIAAGCNDYISKPYSQAELTGLIDKYFN